MFAKIILHRQLIGQLIKREVQNNYRNTFLGIFWLVMRPLLLLSVYAFVFGSVLNARWPNSSENQLEFAIILFAGLIVFNLFSEVISQAPGLIVRNVNYVKKVIFPVEILPLVSLGNAFFQFALSLFVLLIFSCLYYGSLPLTTWYLPVILFPYALLLAGLIFLFAALGVFVRDISQTITFIIPGMMFLSPIFYPLTSVPEPVRDFFYLNPLTFIVEQLRAVMIWGQQPDWWGWLWYVLTASLILVTGYFFFIKTKKGFADVL